jgi:branched-chain amino acid transport system permease protein
MTLQFVITGLTVGSIYALTALGFCVVHNATGIVNFAQTSFIMLGGMFMITFLQSAGVHVVPAFFLSTASVALVGGLLERLGIRPSRSREPIVLIFVTIGLATFMEGTAMLVWGKRHMTYPSFSGDAPLHLFGATIMPQSLWIFGITIAVFVFLRLFFRHTLTGKAIRAVCADRRAAALAGINVNRMIMSAFALSGALGAIAGIIITPVTTTSYDSGLLVGLKGFSAAILGGYGRFSGAILGGLLLGVLESLSAGYVSSAYKDALAFIILLAVLFIRPAGLLGRGESERV